MIYMYIILCYTISYIIHVILELAFSSFPPDEGDGCRCRCRLASRGSDLNPMHGRHARIYQYDRSDPDRAWFILPIPYLAHSSDPPLFSRIHTCVRPSSPLALFSLLLPSEPDSIYSYLPRRLAPLLRLLHLPLVLRLRM